MPWYLLQNKAIMVAIKARDSESALRHFARRYPAYAHLGSSLVRLPAPGLPGVEPQRRWLTVD